MLIVWTALLVVELFVCFAPLAYLLFIGSMFLGVVVVFPASEAGEFLWLALPALGGVAGLVGVASLIDVLLFEQFRLISRTKTFLALSSGVISAAAILLLFRTTLLVLVPCLLALAGTAQLMFLARKHLFPRASIHDLSETA